MLNACLPSLSKGKVLDVRPQSTAQQHTSKGEWPEWQRSVVAVSVWGYMDVHGSNNKYIAMDSKGEYIAQIARVCCIVYDYCCTLFQGEVRRSPLITPSGGWSMLNWTSLQYCRPQSPNSWMVSCALCVCVCVFAAALDAPPSLQGRTFS